jgi:glycosyltransferase involved in cell wall biosynthesis
MRILIVHNEYGKVSGEEIVVRSLGKLLEENGHHVSMLIRSSAEIMGNIGGTAKAFFTGIYNFASRAQMRELIKTNQPDIIHIHNLYPLISPSVLGECRRAGIPIVMTVHNYRLMCPNGLHMVNGQVCEKCTGGREYHCLLNRCEGSLLKSAGYALRGAVARKMRFFHDNVTLFTVLTEFQQRKLIAAGYRAERIIVLPNMTGDFPMDVHLARELPSIGEFALPGDLRLSANALSPGDIHSSIDRDSPASSPSDVVSSSDPRSSSIDRDSREPALGEWVGYAGRISHEKGIGTILSAARALPEVRFKIAGSGDALGDLRAAAPGNVEFVGHLTREQLIDFYRGCRIVALCSMWYEGFPMMLAEAMLHARPVVCSRIGGLPEIVTHGVTGFLFTPGSAEEFTQRIAELWNNPTLCRQMGDAGRQKAIDKYSRARYYDRTIEAYDLAARLHAAN